MRKQGQNPTTYRIIMTTLLTTLTAGFALAAEHAHGQQERPPIGVDAVCGAGPGAAHATLLTVGAFGATGLGVAGAHGGSTVGPKVGISDKTLAKAVGAVVGVVVGTVATRIVAAQYERGMRRASVCRDWFHDAQELRASHRRAQEMREAFDARTAARQAAIDAEWERLAAFAREHGIEPPDREQPSPTA